jgi:hypothetical protein
VLHRRAARIAEAAIDPRFLREVDRALSFRARTVLCVPIPRGEMAIGALHFVNRVAPRGELPGFDEDDLAWAQLAALAFAAGLASIGPYTLEGSRPGAAASAIWLATRLLPLDAEGHGRLLEEPIREARRLHDRLAALPPIRAHGRSARLVPLTVPDATIVCFAVVDEESRSLARSARLTLRAAARLVLPTDEGPRPRISMHRVPLEAAADALAPFFRRARIDVLDATDVELMRLVVMHPWAERAHVGDDLVRTLREEAIPAALAEAD